MTFFEAVDFLTKRPQQRRRWPHRRSFPHNSQRKILHVPKLKGRQGHATLPALKKQPHSMPSMRGSQSEISGMNVTATRNISIVSNHGHTATVSSVMPILAIPDAT